MQIIRIIFNERANTLPQNGDIYCLFLIYEFATRSYLIL